MRSDLLTRAAAIAVPVSISTIAAAATPVAILTEQKQVPGAPAGVTLSTINIGFGTTQSSDYASFTADGGIALSIQTSATQDRAIWGRTSGVGVLGLLDTASTGTRYASVLNLSGAGGVTYGFQNGTASTSPQSIVRNGSTIVNRGDASPIGSLVYWGTSAVTGSRGTEGGTSVFYASLANNASSAGTAGAGLFQSSGGTPTALLASTQTITSGLGSETIASNASAVSTNFRAAGTGATVNYITSARTVGGGGSTSDVMVINGSVPTTGGSLVRLGSLVGGGNGTETWDDFGNDRWDISSNGNWALAADTSAATNDDVLFVNGVLKHREGDIVDGVTLTSFSSGIGVSDEGNYAFISGSTSTLFVNGSKVAAVGDSVTLSDGSTSTLASIFSYGLVKMTTPDVLGNFDVFFFGRSGDTPSSNPDSLFVVSVPEPASLALLGLGALALGRRRRV